MEEVEDIYSLDDDVDYVMLIASKVEVVLVENKAFALVVYGDVDDDYVEN